MEYRPNCRPEQSSPLQSATIIWQGPKYLIFDTKDSRLKSYIHWPFGTNPSPHSLSAASFYYTGIYIITISVSLVESLASSLHTALLFAGQGDRTICFHSGGGLKNWHLAVDAWREHALWFPYCVYIRYIKGEEFIRECRSWVHSCNHTAPTCFSETATGRLQASRHLPAPLPRRRV